jgi:ribosomal protein S18 acetylase RimI-like enzyme
VDLPLRCLFQTSDHDTFAHQVGELRGSPVSQRQAHAQRLASSPVPYTALTITRDGELLACGQMAMENDLVGLYDVYTAAHARGQGLARRLCQQLLASAWQRGARHAYLQVESDNYPARAIYHQLGFVDAYAYHYRQAPGD